MTVLQVLQRTTEFLRKHQIESPRLNAEHLLAHSLGQKRIELYLDFERELTEAELTPLRELVRRRSQGEPLQHLAGTVEFCGLTFRCDKRALVPRPETEELVELLKSKIASAQAKIVDVGTGSGVIALALASQFPEAEVYASDIAEEALALARENAARLGLTSRVTFAWGDLLQPFREQFDVIIANLPYIAASERATLSREVLHDPEGALFAGEQGDQLIRGLIATAPAHLAPAGLLALEVGAGQHEPLTAFLAEKKFHEIEARRDFAGVIRFLFARYG